MRSFDKTDVFDSEIAPLLQLVQQKCNENKIPYFAAYGVKMNNKGMFEKGEGMKCMVLIPESMGIKTNDSFFSEFLNILNGAHSVYESNMEFDVDN